MLPPTFLTLVQDAQFIQYCVFSQVTESMRWKELLQLPVIILPLVLDSVNLSSRASASKISQRRDFIFSSTGMLTKGWVLLHMSHIFIEMRSLVTILRVPSRNITEEYLLMISLRKLVSVVEVKVIVLECLMEVLESLNPREPLLVPKMKSDSECGCSCEHVIFQHFQSLLLLPLDNYFMRKGWPVCSKLHMKAPYSSLANRYYSLRLRLMPLSERQALLGKTCLRLTETKDYQDCRSGMTSSLPADFTIYLGCFSQTFQSLMVLEFEVRSFMYLDCGLSQLMCVMAYPIFALLRVSNSRQ